MEFCIISPIAGLERYARLSRTHLVLAHMLHNPKYEAFYEQRVRAGDTVILDNGAYENTKPLDSAAYVNMIRRLSPSVVVLPDEIMSPWKENTSRALKFLDEFADYLLARGYRHEYMFVPQTTRDRPKDWWLGLNGVVNDARVGHYVSWIGLGRYMATEFLKYNEGNSHYSWRVGVAKLLREVYPELKIHALGMANGDLKELKPLEDVGVTSIDSSAPVWRGWNACGVKDLEKWKEYGSPCQFDAVYPPGRHELILNNLKEVGINVDSCT